MGGIHGTLARVIPLLRGQLRPGAFPNAMGQATEGSTPSSAASLLGATITSQVRQMLQQQAAPKATLANRILGGIQQTQASPIRSLLGVSNQWGA